ncbi:MAG: flavoprotein oxidoreductase [Acidimicrobiia bacterium]|nr:MAG: flavoprotein oxidoreductase [Acidimicrobiia bacterium]
MTRRLVVVGGDAAGMSAASQARRRLGPDRLEIVAFERSSWVSYSACGEPYFVAGYVDPLSRLVARTPEDFAARDIAVHVRSEVTEIDLDRRRVTVHALDEGRTFRVGFDDLVVATGATAVRPDIAGADLEGVFELRTLDDAAALRRVAEAGPGDCVVVGGGYVGLEVAEAFAVRGWRTKVLTSGPSVLERTLDPDLGAKVVDAMRARGIDVVLETQVRCINGSERVESVGCDDATHPADVVVLGLGTRPEVDLAAKAGIPLGETGAIAVDRRQRTRIDGVWAAGDCAETFHRVTRRPVNPHLGTVANKTGRVAGINIGGGDAIFPGVLGTSITRVCDVEVASTGVRESEAEEAGIAAVSATATGTTTAGYWPEAAPLTIRATAERDTGRLLGAQIVSEGPAGGKRIDVFAVAIWTSMPAQELAWTDLAYAPPFSGVWDLIHIAARKAATRAGSIQ